MTPNSNPLMRTILLFFSILFAAAGLGQSVEELTKSAYALENEKKYDEAIEVYNKILKKDTSNYHSYVNRALLFDRLDKIQNAYDDYTKAIELQPDSAVAYHYRAILFYRMTYSEEAISNS